MLPYVYFQEDARPATGSAVVAPSPTPVPITPRANAPQIPEPDRTKTE